MPRIAEVKEIDGHIWVRADITNMENGSAWWSPEEQEKNYREGYRDGKYDVAQWLPIDSAPRDGTPLILLYKDGKKVSVGWWSGNEQIGWGNNFASNMNVSHFLPLHAPPEVG